MPEPLDNDTDTDSEPEPHVYLLIEWRDGTPLQEPVHAVPLGDRLFRLSYSPGFVQGIAAGDEFRLLDDNGTFEVLRRAGNLAVQVFANEPVAPLRDTLTQRVEQLGGSLDGAIERGLTFTIPYRGSFAAIESVMDAWVAEHAGWEWYYGNVYDPITGETPLLWWER